LQEIPTRQFADAIPGPNEAPGLLRVATACVKEALVGLAYVKYQPNADPPFAILHDLVVDVSKRGKGIGGEILKWFEKQAVALGIKHIFLENSAINARAYSFLDAMVIPPCPESQSNLWMEDNDVA